MRNIQLEAVKRCGRHLPGQEFKANSVEARALVAIGHARYPAKSDTYMTRDITSEVTLLVSDHVRDFAAENNIDLTKLVGSGTNGRITKKDVEALIQPKE